MDDARVTLVVTLTVRRAAAEAFRAFEHTAERIMARYGGAIERVVVIDDNTDARSRGRSDTFKEIHIVTFPSAAAFARYRADAELAQAAPLRQTSVVHTDILIGKDGPTYSTE